MNSIFIAAIFFSIYSINELWQQIELKCDITLAYIPMCAHLCIW